MARLFPKFDAQGQHKVIPPFGTPILDGQYNITGYLSGESSSSGTIVYRTQRRSDRAEFSIKRRRLAISPNSRSEWKTPNEGHVHRFVAEHPNVLPVHDVIQQDGYLYVVTSVCEGGRLAGFINESDLFWRRDDHVRRVFLQVVAAVTHCHRMGVAHRAIHPFNILAVDTYGTTFCLADFSRATTEKRARQFGVVHKAYASPETLNGSSSSYRTQAADVWSLGILLIKMISGILPWQFACSSDANYVAYLVDRSHLRSYLALSAELMPLLTRALEPDPAKRITADKLGRAMEKIVQLSMTDIDLLDARFAVARRNMETRARLVGIPFNVDPGMRRANSISDSAWMRSGAGAGELAWGTSKQEKKRSLVSMVGVQRQRLNSLLSKASA